MRHVDDTGRVGVAGPLLLRIRADDGACVPVAIVGEGNGTPVVDVAGVHDFNPIAAMFGGSQDPAMIQPVSRTVDAADLATQEGRQRLGVEDYDVPPQAGGHILDIRIPTPPPDAQERGLGMVAVQVPAGTRLDVRLDGSDLDLRGRFDEWSRVHSERGNVTAKDLSGLVDVGVRHGDLTVDGVGAGAALSTEKGRLDVSNINGSVTLQGAAEGHVTYTEPTDPAVRGKVQVNAVNYTVRGSEYGDHGSRRHSLRTEDSRGQGRFSGRLDTGRLDTRREDPRGQRGPR